MTDTDNKTVDWGLKMAQNQPRGLPSEADVLGLHLHPETVMPTGKTQADKCGTCFTIHSAGQLECW